MKSDFLTYCGNGNPDMLEILANRKIYKPIQTHLQADLPKSINFLLLLSITAINYSCDIRCLSLRGVTHCMGNL